MKTLHLSTFVVLAGLLTAQTNQIGFTRGWNTTYTDRIGGNSVFCDALNHYDNRIYEDWMLDPADATGATYKFAGCRVVTQDQLGTTPEAFNIVAYDEDGTTPNMPGTVWFRTGQINLPASTTAGPVAWIWTITFVVPSTPKGDKFIGLSLALPATGSWPADGLSTHCAFSGTNSDVPGPGITSVNNGNLACFMPTPGGVPTPPATFPAGGGSGRREIFFEISASVAGGVCVTQTNQTTYPSSNPGVVVGATPLGGTTNFLSGNNPNVYDAFNSAPPRQDNIGFLFTDATLPTSPVFTFLSFTPNPLGSIPLTVLAPPANNPNTHGNVCVDFTVGVSFLNFTDAAGVSQFMLTLPAAARAVLQAAAPITIWYQSFGVNPASVGTLEVHATGCGKQYL